jgi:hypothetical protein
MLAEFVSNYLLLYRTDASERFEELSSLGSKRFPDLIFRSRLTFKPRAISDLAIVVMAFSLFGVLFSTPFRLRLLPLDDDLHSKRQRLTSSFLFQRRTQRQRRRADRASARRPTSASGSRSATSLTTWLRWTTARFALVFGGFI